MTKAHMFTDNPLKRLKFWIMQNSFDTVNTVANKHKQIRGRPATSTNMPRHAAGALLTVRQLQVRPHDDADTLDHLLVHPLTIQGG